MTANPNIKKNSELDGGVEVLRKIMVTMIKEEGRDLPLRQLGVFLTCYLNEGDHTVHGLASELNVSKPAITRTLDRLASIDLLQRKSDPRDRRSMMVGRTKAGYKLLANVKAIVATCASCPDAAASRA